ncbi:50S ribosomal protein L3 [Staphylothermus hellenicus]|uniref:Large ribosomal subunit protein uL3 n=1 Tax=Staphylothermus hellenicus (strain DSM 12710 / JCM 10830 / BK20S6-10-b1 / P8) TaxID=591019 RepID=D7D9T9_STAHD|nr:50S ribosomal protein L3 [Staphylothermus hellenicus]ADI32535.1 ribosomal protein L3 [Staphylothermus hellenicus DSM 12710]
MGHRKHSAPRHGSLGVRPRKRAAKIVPRIRSWPTQSWFDLLVEKLGDEATDKGISPKPVLLGYAAYKAGMSHAIIIDDRPHTFTSGKEIAVPVTILDAPPILILGIRGYKIHPMHGLLSFGEVWRSPVEALKEVYEKIYSDNPFVNLGIKDVVRKYLKGLRKVNPGLVKPDPNNEYGFKFLENNWEEKLQRLKAADLADIRVIASTIPVLSGIGKKKPEIIEIKVGGGTLNDRIAYAEKLLGNYITVDQVFREGQFIDIIGVTKGKGFQGVIKRFGVKELPRWHKHRKGSRKIGSRSPGFGTMSETPQPGQTGFHRRTEYNKRIIKIGVNGWEITPKGGFLGYGIVYGPYIMVYGSTIGPRKRLLVLRHPIRPPLWYPLEAPQLIYYSHESKQGV